MNIMLFYNIYKLQDSHIVQHMNFLILNMLSSSLHLFKSHYNFTVTIVLLVVKNHTKAIVVLCSIIHQPRARILGLLKKF